MRAIEGELGGQTPCAISGHSIAIDNAVAPWTLAVCIWDLENPVKCGSLIIRTYGQLRTYHISSYIIFHLFGGLTLDLFTDVQALLIIVITFEPRDS